MVRAALGLGKSSQPLPKSAEPEPSFRPVLSFSAVETPCKPPSRETAESRGHGGMV